MYMYLLYCCATAVNVEIILMFSACKLKRNCRQLAYTCRGWYVLRFVAITVDSIHSHGFYSSVTKILGEVRVMVSVAPL